jgi:hypothetical protein
MLKNMRVHLVPIATTVLVPLAQSTTQALIAPLISILFLAAPTLALPAAVALRCLCATSALRSRPARGAQQRHPALRIRSP